MVIIKIKDCPAYKNAVTWWVDNNLAVGLEQQRRLFREWLLTFNAVLTYDQPRGTDVVTVYSKIESITFKTEQDATMFLLRWS